MPYSIDQEVIDKSNETKEVDLHPLTKWKRFLTYLGDAAISFILAFFLFNVVVYPIALNAVKINQDEFNAALSKRNEVLYGNKLLFYKNDLYPKDDFDKNLKYSYNRFISYYCYSDSIGANDPNYPEYAHLKENEMIRTYYVDIRNDESTYLSFYKKYSTFFTVENTTVTLKEDVKKNLLYYFDPNERLESKDYLNLSEVYSAIYGALIKDIKKNDLTYTSVSGQISFNVQQKIVDDASNTFNMRLLASTLISFSVSVIITHMVIPLISKRRRTILLMALNADRVGSDNLMPLSKLETCLIGVYSFAFEMYPIFLIPLVYTTIYNVISLPAIMILCIATFALTLISLFFMLFNRFNRTLTDIVSRSVIVSGDDLDEIERAKNYGK